MKKHTSDLRLLLNQTSAVKLENISKFTWDFYNPAFSLRDVADPFVPLGA
jgi:hypothetical protein